MDSLQSFLKVKFFSSIQASFKKNIPLYSTTFYFLSKPRVLSENQTERYRVRSALFTTVAHVVTGSSFQQFYIQKVWVIFYVCKITICGVMACVHDFAKTPPLTKRSDLRRDAIYTIGNVL